MQQLQNELTSCNAIMVVLLLLLFLFQTLLPPKLRAKLISNLALQELVPHTKKDDVEVKRWARERVLELLLLLFLFLSVILNDHKWKQPTKGKWSKAAAKWWWCCCRCWGEREEADKVVKACKELQIEAEWNEENLWRVGGGLRRIGMRTKEYNNNNNYYYCYYYYNPQFNDWSCWTALLLMEEGRRKMMNKLMMMMMMISVQLQQLPDQILMYYSLILHHLLHPSTNWMNIKLTL
jgi:hypothetical protein